MELSLGNRGFALTVDAIIGLGFVLLMAMALSMHAYTNLSETTEATFLNLHGLSEDALDTLNKEGVLDQIGAEFTAGNESGAENLTRTYLDLIIPPNVGYEVKWFDNETTYNITSLPPRPQVSRDTAVAQTFSMRLLAGYSKGEPTLGNVARAFLTGIQSKRTLGYTYFGGFEGQGNLTKYLYLPADAQINDASAELYSGSAFDLYVNGAPCISVSSGFSYQDGFGSCFAPGTNTLGIMFSSSNISNHYIGGGFIRVDYNTSQLSDSVRGVGKFEFPGIDGLINYYGSLYVAGTLEEMDIHLELNNSYVTFLTIGDTEVNYTRGSSGIQIIDLDDSFLRTVLNYNELSGATVPIRLGTTNISDIIQEGTADVILITDLSGSMMWQIGSSYENNGVARDCDDPNLYNSNTRRASLAKCLDKQFVDIILNASTNRVGLVGFTSNADNSNYNLDLTSTKSEVISKIDGYPDSPSGGTCICCAINKAYEMLSAQDNVIGQGDNDWRVLSYTTSASEIISSGDNNWKYYYYTGCSSPSTCNPTSTQSSCTPSGWYTTGFDDSAWPTANLPKSNSNERNNVFYYRRHFTLSSAGFSDATLYLRNRRGVECYLNGNLIGSDSSCSTGNYWDNYWSVPVGYFNSPGDDNVLSCRVRSGRGHSRRGIEFDAQLSVSYSCGDSCDPSSTPGSCIPTGDWTDEAFDDSTWGVANLPKSSSNEEDSVFYYRKHFTMSYRASGNATLSVLNRRGVECYLNGNLVGLDSSCPSGTYWDNSWAVPPVYFNSPGDDNVLSCRVRSGTGYPRRGIEFDAQLFAPSDRRKFMIVMSDGVTGYCCGEDYYGCDSTGTQTSGQYKDCGGGQSDCTGSQCNGAINNAIWSAQRANSDLSVIINSVGFGPVEDCTNGKYTLQQIASEANGTYCGSTNASQLRDCYVRFADDILEASIQSQIIDVFGSSNPSILYPNSYIEYTYDPVSSSAGYGNISLTYSIDDVINDSSCTGVFYAPPVSVIDARVTSYSADHWTDYLSTNGISVFQLSDFGNKYFEIGDPYVAYANPQHIESGQNNTVHIETGDSPTNRTGCSGFDDVILTVSVTSGVSYGDTFRFARGCTWDITFEDDSILHLNIPSNYKGNESCGYNPLTVNNFTTQDAINDAIFRLLDSLDFDNDGKVDILFSSEQLDPDITRIGGVRSLWGPARFKLIVWM